MTARKLKPVSAGFAAVFLLVFGLTGYAHALAIVTFYEGTSVGKTVVTITGSGVTGDFDNDLISLTSVGNYLDTFSGEQAFSTSQTFLGQTLTGIKIDNDGLYASDNFEFQFSGGASWASGTDLSGLYVYFEIDALFDGFRGNAVGYPSVFGPPADCLALGGLRIFVSALTAPSPPSSPSSGIPEPSTMLLLGSAFVGLVRLRRKNS